MGRQTTYNTFKYANYRWKSVQSILRYEKIFGKTGLVKVSDIETAFRAYFGMYDGTTKEFGPAQKKLVDGLFHSDLQLVSAGTKIGLSMHKKNIETFLTNATKCEVLEFKVLDATHIEYKVTVQNAKINMTGHSIGTLKDGKLVLVEPKPESKADYEKIFGKTGLVEA